MIDEGRRSIDWAGFIAQQIGSGVVLGLVVGGGAIAVLRGANTTGWSDARFEQLATFAVPVIALFGAQALSGNSFIAAFVAGLTFGSFGSPANPDGADLEGAEAEASSDEALSTRFDAFTEDAAQLLAIGAFFVFGNVLLADALDEITLAVVACVLMTLTVGRMLARLDLPDRDAAPVGVDACSSGGSAHVGSRRSSSGCCCWRKPSRSKASVSNSSPSSRSPWSRRSFCTERRRPPGLRPTPDGCDATRR